MRISGNILLVNPWIYDFAAYNYWCEPLGLLSLGAVLRQAGWEVTLLDCIQGPLYNIKSAGIGKFEKVIIPKPPCFHQIPRHYGRYGISIPEFYRRLSRIEKPESILITSSMTYWYPGVFLAIRLLKRLWPQVPIILGGTYATLCPEHARRFSGADWIVCGEAETRILDILGSALELPGKEAGLSAGGAAEVIQIDLTELPDLQRLPMAAHDLRWSVQGPAAAYIGLETSRGCPFRCSYCASFRLHPTHRRRSVEAVGEEIHYYHKTYGIKHFAFYDDALLVSGDVHFHPLVEHIIGLDLSCAFHTPNGLHARHIDKAVAGKMFRAGFQTIRLGLETTDPDRQERTGGKVTNEEFKKAVSYLKEAGFTSRQLAAYIIIGWPDQTESEMSEAIRFVHHCGVQVRIAEYTPIPHTREAQEGEKQGTEPGACADGDPLLHNNSYYPVANDPEPWVMIDRMKRIAEEGNRLLT